MMQSAGAARALKGLPDAMRVGPFVTQIVIGGPMHDTGLLGSYDENHNVISISCDLSSEQQVCDTLIHEITHGLYRVAALEPGDSEERVITALATGWFGVYRDNPWFPKWLSKHAR